MPHSQEGPYLQWWNHSLHVQSTLTEPRGERWLKQCPGLQGHREWHLATGTRSVGLVKSIPPLNSYLHKASSTQVATTHTLLPITSTMLQTTSLDLTATSTPAPDFHTPTASYLCSKSYLPHSVAYHCQPAPDYATCTLQPKERFFTRLRQQGRTHQNPTVAEALKSAQTSRVVDWWFDW